MDLPKTAHQGFRTLGGVYMANAIEFPDLKAVSFAQWALESGWGRSSLASKFNNYGGAKWRTYMAPYAKSVAYTAHDGRTDYCRFANHTMWIEGYWARFDLEPAYRGWRKHTSTPQTFLNFIGPIWLGMGATKGLAYVRLVNEIETTWKFAKQFEQRNTPDVFTLEEIQQRFADYSAAGGLQSARSTSTEEG